MAAVALLKSSRLLHVGFCELQEQKAAKERESTADRRSGAKDFIVPEIRRRSST
jgi:hypothetical protein